MKKSALILAVFFLSSACVRNRKISAILDENSGGGSPASEQSLLECSISTPLGQSFELMESNGTFYKNGVEVAGASAELHVRVRQKGVPVSFYVREPILKDAGIRIVSIASDTEGKVIDLLLTEEGRHEIQVEVGDLYNPLITRRCAPVVFELKLTDSPTFQTNLTVNNSPIDTEIAHEGQVNLNWNVPSAASCQIIRKDYLGNQTLLAGVARSGSRSEGPFTNLGNSLRTTQYTLICQDSNGVERSNQVSVHTRPEPHPYIQARSLIGGSPQANVLQLNYGQGYQVDWNVGFESISTSCEIYVNDVLQPFGGLQGFRLVNSAVANALWKIRCWDLANASDKTEDSVQVFVENVQAPTCSLTVNREDLEIGESVTATLTVYGQYDEVKIDGQVFPGPNFQKVIVPTALGVKTVTGRVAKAGSASTCMVNFEVHERAAPWDFGGIYAEGTAGRYLNPATNQHSCPFGYTDRKVYGTSGKDHALHICYRAKVPGENPVFDFAGAAAGYWSGTTSTYRTNPYSGTTSAPAGYSTQDALGTAGFDFSMYWGYRPHQDGRAPQWAFGGMYSPAGYGNTAYTNPMTGGYSCPSGFSAQLLLQSTFDPGDSPLYICHRTFP